MKTRFDEYMDDCIEWLQKITAGLGGVAAIAVIVFAAWSTKEKGGEIYDDWPNTWELVRVIITGVASACFFIATCVVYALYGLAAMAATYLGGLLICLIVAAVMYFNQPSPFSSTYSAAPTTASSAHRSNTAASSSASPSSPPSPTASTASRRSNRTQSPEDKRIGNNTIAAQQILRPIDAQITTIADQLKVNWPSLSTAFVQDHMNNKISLQESYALKDRYIAIAEDDRGRLEKALKEYKTIQARATVLEDEFEDLPDQKRKERSIEQLADAHTRFKTEVQGQATQRDWPSYEVTVKNLYTWLGHLSPIENWCVALQISRDDLTDQRTVKKAYLRQAKHFHPDRNKESSVAVMTAITEARDGLLHHLQRKGIA